MSPSSWPPSRPPLWLRRKESGEYRMTHGRLAPENLSDHVCVAVIGVKPPQDRRR
jgi:hypothetical protein